VAVNIIVCVKQVVDPEMPASAFKIDSDTKRVVESQGTPPVLNGFDENAVEAALRIKDTVGANITVISMGKSFVMDVVKKPLSMGADELVLLQDDAFDDLDSYATAAVLSEAIKKIGTYDLVLAGRQASDWDNAQVPLGVAELLDLPCLTVAQKVDVNDGTVAVQQVLPEGYQELEADLPALVTVSNEIGEPRYATLRGIMAAGRKTPTVWTAADLGIDTSSLTPKVIVADLYVPETERSVQIIEGDDDADAGRKLALKLREDKLI
jgi:electron transfer flavoprotein beta subunit